MAPTHFFPEALLSLEEIETAIMDSIEGYINQVEIDFQVAEIQAESLLKAFRG